MADVIDCEFSVEGNGPALVLIHGVGAGRNTWAYALPLLTPHFTVVTYDLRGHGASPLPLGDFGLEDLVADLERVRQRAGIGRAHFVGHSLGGMIASAYALKYPHRVLSLGLVSTSAFRGQDDITAVQGRLRTMETQGISAGLQQLTERWFTPQFIGQHPEVAEARMNQVLATDPHVFLNVFRIFAQTEMSGWLGDVTAPTLVMTGEGDPSGSPDQNRQIAKALPNAELVILPKLRHSLLLEAGDTVARNIVRFIAAHPPEPQ